MPWFWLCPTCDNRGPGEKTLQSRGVATAYTGHDKDMDEKMCQFSIEYGSIEISVGNDRWKAILPTFRDHIGGDCCSRSTHGDTLVMRFNHVSS